MGRPATTVPKQKIDIAWELLDSLAKNPQTVSVKELVEKVLPKIKEAQAAGYSLEQIAEALTKAEIKISASTLKVYLKDLSGNTAQIQASQPLETKTKPPNQAKQSQASEQTAEPEASTPSAQTEASDLATEAVKEPVERGVQESAKTKGKLSILASKDESQDEIMKEFDLPGAKP